MKKIVVSAPGKLHLSGEHAVVYGKPALLTSISKRLFVTVTETSGSELVIDLPDVHSSDTTAGQKLIKRLLTIAQTQFQHNITGLTVSVHSEFPIASGLGSSAALSVALVGAMSQLVQAPWNQTDINEKAYSLEKLIHGNPSGGDNTIASFGGLLWYRKEFEFLKTFWMLPFTIPKNFGTFFLFDTKRHETTADLIGFVTKKSKVSREAIFNQMELVTKTIVQAIKDEDKKQFIQSLTENERLLENLGVVSAATKKLIRAIEIAGGVAKISGAGGRKSGSGMVLALLDETVAQKIAQKFQVSLLPVSLGGPGVKLEKMTL
ncbi:mevalonate kinase [Candidatus Microgenomates bacterium]|nr:MAG: mevalonate kinase [Candidatus Microgenomates bacterium]